MLGTYELKWRVARYLKEGRKAKSLTLYDVSQLTKISKSQVSRLERANTKMIDLHDIVTLAWLYEIDLNSMVGRA